MEIMKLGIVNCHFSVACVGKRKLSIIVIRKDFNVASMQFAHLQFGGSGFLMRLSLKKHICNLQASAKHTRMTEELRKVDGLAIT